MTDVSQVLESQLFYDSDSTLKVLLVGDAEVGKTSIIKHLCGETFQANYSNTIVSKEAMTFQDGFLHLLDTATSLGIDFKTLFYTVKGEPVKVQIWDTAGQERFHTITRAYYRGSHGIVLVYDVTSEDSFSNIDKWVRSIREEGPDDAYLFLFGNKLDLASTWRCIDTSRGEALARKYKMQFAEVSAKTGENTQEAFKTFVKGLKQQTAKAKDRRQHDYDAVDGPSVRVTAEGGEGRREKRSGCKCNT